MHRLTERQYRARERKAMEQWRRQCAMDDLVREFWRRYDAELFDHSNDGPCTTGGVEYWITTNVSAAPSAKHPKPKTNR